MSPEVTKPGVMLRMRGITKSFGGVHALQNADFDLLQGEVHALLGQNGAGKSTLVNVISGVYIEYDGEIDLAGEPVKFHRPADAHDAGIATIHQELDLVPEMTLAENLFLGREPRTPFGLCDRQRMITDAGELLDQLGIHLDPTRRINSLRVGEQQLVEIARALSLDARILIMDEPTSALADTEVQQLFEVVRDVRRHGVSVLYISHRLEELAGIADRATVLRDGGIVGTVTVADTAPGKLIQMMVGQHIEQLFPVTHEESRTELLRVDDLHVTPRSQLVGRREPSRISLVVHEGEIVGLAGLMGSGRTELLETLYGEGPPGSQTGSITLAGEEFQPASSREAIAAGVGFVSEDRKGSGLALSQSVRANMTLAALRRFCRGGLVQRRRERLAITDMIRDLKLKTSGQSVEVSTLSGGNQQKVVFGRQLLISPRLLLLDEPTRGVDIGARAEIYRLLAALADEGIGILMASSELPELLGVCHRIVVLRDGAVVSDVDSATTSQEAILESATSTTSEVIAG